ncbi:MAG: hypothetical protein ABWZ88_04000 [Variovorax sp.]
MPWLADRSFAHTLKEIHELLAHALMALAVLHAAAALLHHFVIGAPHIASHAARQVSHETDAARAVTRPAEPDTRASEARRSCFGLILLRDTTQNLRWIEFISR